MGELLYAGAYMAHPYHWPVVGWMADIDSIHTTDLERYFQTFYAPNNCTMILVGDFDSRLALPLFEKYFSSIPRGPAPTPVPNNEPPQTGERRIEHHFPAQAPSFYAGYHIPSVSSPDVYPLEVLGTLLGTGESSRLYRRLVYQEQIALAAEAGFRWRLDPGLFTVYVEMSPEHAAAEGEKSAYDEIAKVAADGVAERELTKAKNQVRADLLRSLKTNEGRGEQIGTYDLWFGDPQAMGTALARIEAVKGEDVKRVAKQYFDAKNRTVVILVPEKEGGTP
jgi:predicted Zn-dependent peptidase